MPRILSLFVGAALLPGSLLAAPMVELFTSQGCYSCPPADEHLAELIEKHPEVVALEFHVDYWDDLVYGSAGVWKDPFSDAAYSKRQRDYNKLDLKGKRGVYTPQMIVNGATAQVGTRRSAVKKALKYELPPLKMTTRTDGTQVEVSVSGEYDAQALVWLAVFDKYQSTEVTRGENHGKLMINHQVVRELTPIADWRDGGGVTVVDVPSLQDANVGCAVFVQELSVGKVLGAEYC